MWILLLYLADILIVEPLARLELPLEGFQQQQQKWISG